MASSTLEDGFIEVGPSALIGGNVRTLGIGERSSVALPLDPIVPKRQRGRPRKRNRRVNTGTGGISDQEDNPPKRRRGRPPGTGRKQRAAKAAAASARGSPSDKKSGSSGSVYTSGGSGSAEKSLERLTKRELQEALKTKNRRKRYIPRLAPPS